MRADGDIRHDVLPQLDFDPKIGSRDIALAVRDGVVVQPQFCQWRSSAGSRLHSKRGAEIDADAITV